MRPGLRALAVLALASSACAALKPRPLDPGLFLLPPGAAGVVLSLTQALIFSKGASHFESLAAVEVSKDSVALAGLSPLGNRMLSLRWDGKTLEQEHDASLPPDLPLKLILRDLQLAFWPQAAVQGALGRDWTLEDDGSTRLLKKSGQTVVKISYGGTDRWHSKARFEHLGLGYQLDINPVDDNE